MHTPTIVELHPGTILEKAHLRTSSQTHIFAGLRMNEILCVGMWRHIVFVRLHSAHFE